MIATEHRIFSLFLGMIISVWACVFTGCGYHFRATGEPLGTELESLAIPLIESSSSNIGFEADFTRIIREEFISQGKVPIVPREEAQTILSGRIYEIWTEPLSYRIQQQTVSGVETTFEVTKTRRLRLKLEMRLTERRTGEVIWQEQAMEERVIFAVSDDPLVTQFNQRIALEAVARELAKRIFLKTMERF